MLSFLETILATVEQFGLLVAWAVIEVLNVVLETFNVLFSAISIIELPATPSMPSVVSGINWFFPVGTVITVGSSLAVSYGAFLGVRWLFKKAGTL